MLQCSKYKASPPGTPIFHTGFTMEAVFAGRAPGPVRFRAMEHSTEDLRNLLSVAKKLRRLAVDTPAAADRDLYIAAAAVLETRAGWLATHLPGDHCEPRDAGLHQPVDLMV
jgi:hypothetical protein